MTDALIDVPVEHEGKDYTLSLPADYDENQRDAAIHQFLSEQGADLPPFVGDSTNPLDPSFVGPTRSYQEKDLWQEIKRDIPKMVGGIVGPLAVAGKAGQLIQSGQALKGSGLMAGAAGLFGAAGESGQVIWDVMTDNPEAPKTWTESAKRIGYAGGEQAALEVIGQSLFKLFEVSTRAMRSNVSLGTKMLAKEFQEAGGKLTLPQVSTSAVTKFFGSIAENAFLSKPMFEKAFAEQEVVLREMTKDLATKMSSKANELDDFALGQLVTDTINDGSAAHTAASQILYKDLDKLIGQQEVVKTLKTTNYDVDTAGNIVANVVEKEASKLIDNAPVDMRPIKEWAAEQLQQIERVGSFGGSERKRMLKELTDRPDQMLFSDADFLRSDALGVQRGIQDSTEKGRIKALTNNVVTRLTDAMQTAATKTGDPQVIKAYTRAHAFYKKGKEAFNDEFVTQLFRQGKKNPAAVGEMIWRDGNVQQVMTLKKVLRRSAALDPKINYSQTLQDIQAGYLRDSFSKMSTDIDGSVSLDKFRKIFTDPKKKRTMEALFNTEQKNKLKEFFDITAMVRNRDPQSLGMVVQLIQGGTAASVLVWPTLPFTEQKGPDKSDVAQAIAIMGGPYFLGKFLVNPKRAALLIQAAKTPKATSLGRQLTTKITAEMAIVAQEIRSAADEQYLEAQQ